MDIDDIDRLLTSEFGLLTDSRERGNGRTYFHGKVDRNPATTTQVVRVLFSPDYVVTRVKKLVSSDSNNSVFVPEPLSLHVLRDEVAREIKLFGSSSIRS